ncbi:MAG: molybdenum cofactor guanylyltransferase [Acidobacteriota bacterium]|jgi:molybdopterin-guanine dinucleotide biosynthesis protein A
MVSERCAAALLAGGTSRRMGIPKPGLQLGGITLAGRALRTLRALTDAVVQAGGEPIAGIEVPLLPDRRRDAGPAAGIEAALTRFDLPVAVLAVDLPFVVPTLLEEALHRVERGAEICAPHWRGRWHPLCAVYSPDALPRIARRLDADKHGLQGLLQQLGTALPDDLLQTLGDPDRLLLNINTPEDLQRARSILGEVGK